MKIWIWKKCLQDEIKIELQAAGQSTAHLPKISALSLTKKLLAEKVLNTWDTILILDKRRLEKVLNTWDTILLLLRLLLLLLLLLLRASLGYTRVSVPPPCATWASASSTSLSSPTWTSWGQGGALTQRRQSSGIYIYPTKYYIINHILHISYTFYHFL